MVYYFIFGGEATNIIHRVGFKYFVDNCLDIEHESFEFAYGDDPCSLLERYTGWSDYYVMNKEEWESYQKSCMIK
jgi:hypothetical protein